MKNIPTFSQHNLSSCSCGCFSASFKSSSSLISLCAAVPSVSNNFNITTVIIPPMTANKALRKIFSLENISARCCLASYDLSHKRDVVDEITLVLLHCYTTPPPTSIRNSQDLLNSHWLRFEQRYSYSRNVARAMLYYKNNVWYRLASIQGGHS